MRLIVDSQCLACVFLTALPVQYLSQSRTPTHETRGAPSAAHTPCSPSDSMTEPAAEAMGRGFGYQKKTYPKFSIN